MKKGVENMTKNTLFQHGTMQVLVEGLLEGTLPLSELLKHGNIGIGTGDGVDGELVILDDVGYKIDVSGRAVKLPEDFKVTYADVSFADYHKFKSYQNVELVEMLKDVLTKNNAQNQVEFEAENISGTMITYYTPTVFQGVGVSGFHNHFLADDLSFGGHVLAATVKDVTVSVQPIEDFELHLPIDNQEFLNANLTDISKLDNVISKSE